MALSVTQIALFGQVRVNVLPVDSNLVSYVTLLDLYKNGWWATERFGTLIALVKPRAYEKDGFSCLIKRIVTDVNLDALDREIKIIADAKYEKYKSRLDENRRKCRLKNWKINESDL